MNQDAAVGWATLICSFLFRANFGLLRLNVEGSFLALSSQQG